MEYDERYYERLATLGTYAPLGADQVRQSIYYNAGLGTQVGSKVRGGMFGAGIDDILLETYQWLVENDNGGDDIFIFGLLPNRFERSCPRAWCNSVEQSRPPARSPIAP